MRKLTDGRCVTDAAVATKSRWSAVFEAGVRMPAWIDPRCLNCKRDEYIFIEMLLPLLVLWIKRLCYQRKPYRRVWNTRFHGNPFGGIQQCTINNSRLDNVTNSCIMCIGRFCKYGDAMTYCQEICPKLRKTTTRQA